MNVVPTEQNATIATDADLVTLVNVFKVKPDSAAAVSRYVDRGY